MDDFVGVPGQLKTPEEVLAITRDVVRQLDPDDEPLTFTIHFMRGPSGCGKSTLTEEIMCEAIKEKLRYYCFSADSLFEGVDGYSFDVGKLPEYHTQTLVSFIEQLHEAFTLVEDSVFVVDNTNIKYWQFEAYLGLLLVYSTLGININIVIHQWVPKTMDDVRLCVGRNVHQVPDVVILRMCYEFQELTAEQAVTIGKSLGIPPACVDIQNHEINENKTVSCV